MSNKSTNSLYLNIAEYNIATRSLGPGQRFALWVQGCPFNCENCISPQWIPFKRAQVHPVNAVAELVLAQQEISGLTISGGEPFMQARRLAELIRLIRVQQPHYTYIAFTGFQLNQLIWDDAKDLLDQLDLLIDGQYVSDKNDGVGLKGSSNQQFHFLSDRLLAHRTEIEQERPSLEFRVLNDGVLMSGIPKKSFSW